MKAILLFCVGLLTASVQGTPTARSNWPAVEQHVARLEELVYYTMYAIYTDSNNDNPDVGEKIGQKVNDAAESGMDLLNIVTAEVDARTLTVEIARVHLGSLLVVFTDLYAAIEVDLQGLSEAAKTKVDGDFSNLYLNVPRIANEIYAALEEEAPLSCGIAGINNNETIISDPVQSDLPPGIEIWKEPVYFVDYGSIPLHPHNKYLDIGISNNELWFRTTVDFPNFTNETNSTSIQRVIQFHCVDGATVLYEFEFPLEDGPIVEPTLPPDDE